MNFKFRSGTNNDISSLKMLTIKSWGQFKSVLTSDNWLKLHSNISNDKTYIDLIQKSYSFLCTKESGEIIGMAFLIPKGNPNDIYNDDWCYIRFLTVDPDFRGFGIGKQLTQLCTDKAKETKETVIALHTSEFMNDARHIYEKMGFKILKEIDQRLGKRYWLYTLEL